MLFEMPRQIGRDSRQTEDKEMKNIDYSVFITQKKAYLKGKVKTLFSQVNRTMLSYRKYLS